MFSRNLFIIVLLAAVLLFETILTAPQVDPDSEAAPAPRRLGPKGEKLAKRPPIIVVDGGNDTAGTVARIINDPKSVLPPKQVVPPPDVNPGETSKPVVSLNGNSNNGSKMTSYMNGAGLAVFGVAAIFTMM